MGLRLAIEERWARVGQAPPGLRFWLGSCVVLLVASSAAAQQANGPPAERYDSWPVLEPVFPSTGGGGVMIGGYQPVIKGSTCVTPFTATEPNGTVHRNVVEFDAVPAQGGTLCQNGRWRSADGGSQGTTPFRVFIKDGISRGSP